jgi:hypothetical protein
VFGLGSNDEMCIDFVGYYPRDAIPASEQRCGYKEGSGKLVEMVSIDQIHRRFGDNTVVKFDPGSIDGVSIGSSVQVVADGSGSGSGAGSVLFNTCSSLGCYKASECYVVGSGCNADTQQFVTNGDYSDCAAAVGICDACFPDSPCIGSADHSDCSKAPLWVASKCPPCADCVDADGKLLGHAECIVCGSCIPFVTCWLDGFSDTNNVSAATVESSTVVFILASSAASLITV